MGAVAVLGGRVAGRAHHQTKGLRDPSAHAVMIVLTQAAEGMQGDRGRAELQLFVTEMPCRMCVAAAQLAGVRRIVHGTRRRAAAARIRLVGGVLGKECAALRRARVQA